MSALEQLAQGHIVWARVTDPHGHAKTRPLVVITATDQILLNTQIVGVAITCSFENPPPENCVLLPWHRRKHPATGLTRRSAAVCNWLVTLTPSDIERIEGYVPGRYLLEILRKLPRA